MKCCQKPDSVPWRAETEDRDRRCLELVWIRKWTGEYVDRNDCKRPKRSGESSYFYLSVKIWTFSLQSFETVWKIWPTMKRFKPEQKERKILDFKFTNGVCRLNFLFKCDACKGDACITTRAKTMCNDMCIVKQLNKRMLKANWLPFSAKKHTVKRQHFFLLWKICYICFTGLR